MTVDELISKLEPFRGRNVRATWEGIIRDIEVYQAKNGEVLIDADECLYQARWQDLSCHCGKPAVSVRACTPLCGDHDYDPEDN